MQKLFWFLFALILTACAAPAATPLVLSPVIDAAASAPNEIQPQVTLMTPVLAGNNALAVQLRDAKTGKPLHDATVRVAIVAPKHSPTKSDDDHSTVKKDDHAKTDDHSVTKKDDHAKTDDHGATKKDDHAKTESQSAGAKNSGHDDGDTGHAGKPLTAGKSEGEYTGQVMIPNAGDWWLVVQSEIAGKEEMTMFAVNATRAPETWLVLGGFLGVNLAVIVTAGMTKRRIAKK
jgi:hypothetical protein